MNVFYVHYDNHYVKHIVQFKGLKRFTKLVLHIDVTDCPMSVHESRKFVILNFHHVRNCKLP